LSLVFLPPLEPWLRTKWSAKLSYFPTMTEMAPRHKQSARIFFRFGPAPERIATAAQPDANCPLGQDGSNHEFRQ
jgi:hypothetical protein